MGCTLPLRTAEQAINIAHALALAHLAARSLAATAIHSPSSLQSRAVMSA